MSAIILPASPDAYARAAALLKRGELVGLPTETVYGLAGDAKSSSAARKIYAVKGRPSHNPLIAHVLDPKDASTLAHINESAAALIKAFWPGPLTLVLPRKDTDLSAVSGAGLPTIAVRCPDVPWRQAFIDAGFKGPIIMPSANLSGHISPTTAAHVAADLGDKISLIIDGGPCAGGVESTILKIEEDHAVLLRPGTLTTKDFAPYISDLRLAGSDAQISAPGMLKSHYAPNAHVRLNAADKRSGEAYLAFGPCAFVPDFNLSETGNLEEAARNLYTALRALDKVPTIAVAPIPSSGIGAAINDRLQRAAAER